MNSRRTHCVVCLGDRVEPLVGIAHLPVYMGCVDAPPDQDVFADAHWLACSTCGCVQLREIPAAALVYLGQHNEVVGGTWRRHHDSFAEFVASYAPRRVVEIGGAHGWLAQQYSSNNDVDDWLVVEPNPTFDASGPVRVSKAFIEDDPSVLTTADAVVHSHVLEHVLAPREFMSLVAAHSAPGELQLLSVPNLQRLLELDGANALNFEHTFSFDRATVEWMLEVSGFRILEFREFEQHSFFVAAERVDRVGVRDDAPMQQSAHGFVGFVERAEADAGAINDRLASVGSERAVFIHGAHVFTQFLVAQSLDVRRIDRVLDNALGKQGKRLYGTSLVVGRMEELVNAAEPILIVRATHYSDEVIAQARELNPAVEIW